MRLVEVSGVRGILTGAGLGEGGAEFAGGVGYEGAGAEELGERCGDMGGGGQDHSPPYCCPCRPRPAQARMPRGAVLWSFSRDRDHDHNLGGDRRHHRSSTHQERWATMRMPETRRRMPSKTNNRELRQASLRLHHPG